jgi:hypothetical protein
LGPGSGGSGTKGGFKGSFSMGGGVGRAGSAAMSIISEASDEGGGSGMRASFSDRDADSPM